MQHLQLVVPRYQRSGGEKGLAVGWLARLLEHLRTEVSIVRDYIDCHTSFCDFCKGQAGTSLKVDIFGIYKCA